MNHDTEAWDDMAWDEEAWEAESQEDDIAWDDGDEPAEQEAAGGDIAPDTGDWDETGGNGLGWDESGLDGMEWDETAQDGMTDGDTIQDTPDGGATSPPPGVVTPQRRVATVYGDTEGELADAERGGDQDIVPAPELYQPFGPDVLAFTAYGDADMMEGQAAGGADTITAVSGSAVLVGDARLMWEEATGGDDLLRANGFRITIAGDAEDMWGDARGGNDTVAGGGGIASRSSAVNDLYGDAFMMVNAAVGGDDLVVGGGSYPGSVNYLYGDAHTMLEDAAGGADTLVGGANARNEMWGDTATRGEEVTTGADVFVITPTSGTSFIHDFESGKDRIDLTAFAGRGIAGFADLQAVAEVDEGGTYALFGRSGSPDVAPGVIENSLTVFGYSSLQESDFIFGAA